MTLNKEVDEVIFRNGIFNEVAMWESSALDEILF